MSVCPFVKNKTAMWAFWGQEPYLFFFVSQYLAEANNNKNAEWINDNYLLKATRELSNHLKDLEVKLPIGLGFEIKITVMSKAARFRWSEKAASECREAWAERPATLRSSLPRPILSAGEQSVQSWPPVVSLPELTQVRSECRLLSLQSRCQAEGRTKRPGFKPLPISESNNESPLHDRITVLSSLQAHFRNSVQCR